MPPLPHPCANTGPSDDGMAAFRMGNDPYPCKMPEIIRKRVDFLAAARARRQPTPGFLLQARDRGDDGPARVGFTCSKKIGNAVTRNRAKRRLREVARLRLTEAARPGWDYVLIGRPEATINRQFALLCDDLSRALRKVHK